MIGRRQLTSANPFDHLYPVHPGHPAIEQHRAIRLAGGRGAIDFVQRGLAALDTGNQHAPRGERLLQDHSVDGSVVDDQDAHARQVHGCGGQRYLGQG